uniref:ATP synthase F0 subunit 8 n=1 Tax=Eunoe nodosa TaxID=862926 RepID=A0A8B6QMG7_9ANNE|nr:ATP synthase F0 subunit 8 [Eunoe nodosa]QTJ29910.1 ATP synthase F0 subunit 8 [Eunoe nodosa]
MPHLSPLNWILSPVIFWFLLISFSSILWWSQSISFPKMSSSLITPQPINWSW